MISILNYTFDHEKQFYKINYSVENVDRITFYLNILVHGNSYIVTMYQYIKLILHENCKTRAVNNKSFILN